MWRVSQRIGNRLMMPVLVAAVAITAAGDASYSQMVETCLATLTEKGTDRYGTVHAPIWVLNLDLETLDCFPAYRDRVEELQRDFDAGKLKLYSPVVPYGVGHRVIRVSQRPAGCSNLFVDQPMIRAALLHDRLYGEGPFARAVRDYVHHYLHHFRDEKTGLIEWGVHTSYNVFEEDYSAYDGRLHEVQAILPMWPDLHALEPGIIRPYLEQFWNLHTDHETGRVDRHHNSGGKGLGFAMAAGEIILACAYLHTLEPDQPWVDRALQVAQAHWDARNKQTDLFPNRAYDYGNDGDQRFDRLHGDTSITGFWASRVLMAGRLTGNAELTEMARATLKAWARYGWDEEADLPWAGLLPDGRAVNRPRDYTATSYDKFDPTGHWDLWKDYVYGFEAPLYTLMTYAMAALWLDDDELAAHAKRLAECYRRHLPANGDQGTFAANYGQAISFFLAMEELTGDAGYRETAHRVAQEAVGHLWTGALFRGFRDRTHYSAIEGAGYLVQALLELEADPARLKALREDNIFLWNL